MNIGRNVLLLAATSVKVCGGLVMEYSTFICVSTLVVDDITKGTLTSYIPFLPPNTKWMFVAIIVQTKQLLCLFIQSMFIMYVGMI